MSKERDRERRSRSGSMSSSLSKSRSRTRSRSRSRSRSIRSGRSGRSPSRTSDRRSATKHRRYHGPNHINHIEAAFRDTNSDDPRAVAARVFVGNIPSDRLTKEEIIDVFTEYGRVTAVTLLKGYGFIQFSSDKEAKAAVEGRNMTFLKDQKIEVKMAFEGRKKFYHEKSHFQKDYRGGRDHYRDHHERAPPPRERVPYDDPYRRPPPERDPYRRDPYPERDPYLDRDPYARDPRDPYARDPRDLRDPYGRDPRDLPPRDPRDPYARDPRDPYAREHLAARDPYARDLPPRDLPPRDLHPRDLPPRDLPPRDLPPRDLPPRDLPPRADPYAYPSRAAPAQPPVSAKPVDCEITVTHAEQRDYATGIDLRLKSRSMLTSMNILPGEEYLTRATDDVLRRALPYNIVITPQNETHRSITLKILHGTPQEHRNMPLDDAIALITRNFEEYSKAQREKTGSLDEKFKLPDQETAYLLNLAADNRFLRIDELNKLIRYFTERRDALITKQGGIVPGRESDPNGLAQEAALEKQQHELQSKILSVLGDKPTTTTLVPPQQPATSPSTSAALDLTSPSVQQALNSLISSGPNLLQSLTSQATSAPSSGAVAGHGTVYKQAGALYPGYR